MTVLANSSVLDNASVAYLLWDRRLPEIPHRGHFRTARQRACNSLRKPEGEARRLLERAQTRLRQKWVASGCILKTNGRALR